MPSLSSQSADILRALESSSTLGSRLFGRRIDPSTLRQLAAVGDPLAAAALVPFLLEADADTTRELASAIRSLMAVPPLELISLGEACRSVTLYDVVDWTAWRELMPRDVRRLASLLGAEAAPVLGIASFHANGFVRQSAVECLDALEAGDELAYLIPRLNDWVTRIAEVTRAAVLRRVDARWATPWAQVLPLVTRLEVSTRRSHDDVVQAVFGLLREPAHRGALEVALGSDDRPTRRLAHRLARESPGSDIAAIVRQALDDPDPVVRLEAVRHGCRSVDAAALESLLDTIEANAFMPVRRAGLDAAAERLPGTVAVRAERALMDQHGGVRELARFLVKKHNAAALFPGYYHGQLGAATSASRQAIAVAGIGETGAPTDAAAIVSFLGHERASVRVAALRALARLDHNAHVSAFVAAFADATPRVTHAARDALRANSTLIDLDTLRSVVRDVATVHGRKDALAVGERLGKWQSLLLWLDASASDDLDIAQHARQLLNGWIANMNRRSAAPRASELASVDAALQRLRFAIDDGTRDAIARAIGPWRA